MNKQKARALPIAILIVLSTLCQTAQSQNQTPSPSLAEDVRISRLIGLAKIWGTVKFFHPFLAYRDIDWDKALIEAIPRVNAAKTPQEYETAINQMLGLLNDKSTHAVIEVEPKKSGTSQSPAAATKHVRTENGVLVIEATQIAKAFAQNNAALRGFMDSINRELPTAHGVVIDARASSATEELDYYFVTFIRQTLQTMLDTNVVLGSTRYRMHNGYATQTGSGASFYYSAFVNSAPQIIEGRGKTKTPPIAFIVNQNSPPFTEMLSGMQSANRAFVVQEGEEPPESDSGTFSMELPEKVKVRMRTVELVNSDSSIGLQVDAVVPKSPTVDAAMNEALRAIQDNGIDKRPKRNAPTFASQVSQKDKAYAEMEFPRVEYRLLALFRFWNVINYFFPYKRLIGETWETVLPRYIPKFEANKDVVDYQLTVRELTAEIHDSHGGVRNANAAQDKMGTFLPPVLIDYVEDKSVVTKVLDDKLPIKVGDIVLDVNGEPVERRREFLARYVAASTSQWLMKVVHALLLLGPKDSVVKLSLRGPGGDVRSVELPRSLSMMDPKLFSATDRTSPIIQVLPSGYGYVDLARLQRGEVDKMFDTIRNTPAVIFDMRGYPNGTAWPIAPRLTEKKNVVAALFSRPILEGRDLSESFYEDLPNYSFAQRLPESTGDVYKGKVVMLINEEAISQAEHTCMFFEAATDVTFIGTPTAGANGDVTFMVLPGNLSISFTGHNVRHADGRQLQRVGIQPTVKVAPTIRGVIEGRDEVLERAVKYLQETLKR